MKSIITLLMVSCFAIFCHYLNTSENDIDFNTLSSQSPGVFSHEDEHPISDDLIFVVNNSISHFIINEIELCIQVFNTKVVYIDRLTHPPEYQWI